MGKCSHKSSFYSEFLFNSKKKKKKKENKYLLKKKKN